MIIVENNKNKLKDIYKVIKKIKDIYDIDVYDLNSFSYNIKLETINLDEEEILKVKRLLSNNNIKYKYET
jgi:hypothetical protein